MTAQFAQTLRAVDSDSPRLSHRAWLISGALVLAWAAWFGCAPVTVYEVSERARLEVSHAAHSVDAVLSGQVVSTALQLGKFVNKGDVLVELDGSEARLRIKEEETRLDAFADRMAVMKREIEARKLALNEDAAIMRDALAQSLARKTEADVALDFAVRTEARIARLVASGTATRVEGQKAAAERRRLAAAQLALDAEFRKVADEAKARRHTGTADIERLNYELTSLAGDYTTTQAVISRLSRELEQRVILAAVSGRLADVLPFHVGSYVSEGQRLAAIVPDGALGIVADFAPASTMGRVKVGQAAVLRLDGFPWAQFGVLAARVTKVDGEVRDNLVRVELSVEARTDGGLRLQHGLPGTVEVSVERVTPAVLTLRAAGVMLADRASPPLRVAGSLP